MTEQDWAERERDLAHEAEHEEAVAIALREAVATMGTCRCYGVEGCDACADNMYAILNALPALLDELEAARAVLETAENSSTRKAHQVWLVVDRAAWLKWRERQFP